MNQFKNIKAIIIQTNDILTYFILYIQSILYFYSSEDNIWILIEF